MQDLSCRQIYLHAMEGLKYTIKKIPARTVVGIACRTSNAEAAVSIPACWQKFLMNNAPVRIAHRTIPPAMYAVYSQYEKDWTGPYTYLLGCGVNKADKVPEGLEAWEIPEQTYAVFRARGQMPAEILGVWANVWSSDLPRTYTYDFELYDKRFTRPLNKEAEVYVAIEPNDDRVPI